MPQLLSGVREVGYYGESQPFSIGTNTNNLRLNITLIQVPGTGTGGGTGTTDATAPSIEQVNAISTPTSDSTPEYTFKSTKAGTITYGGPCSSSSTSANVGNNTITLNALSDGTYYNCTIKVTDSNGNVSNTLTITTFTVATTAPSTTAPSATAHVAGLYHSCTKLDNGVVKCWGFNNYGELGIDNTTQMGDGPGEMAQLTGINLGTGRTATALAAGLYHTCAKLDNGNVKCWGRNNYGQLGIDNTTDMGDDQGEMVSLPSINF